MKMGRTAAVLLFFAAGRTACILPAGAEGVPAFRERLMPREACVRYAVENSFEVKLAKLDLYIAETDILYSEAVFDTLFYAGAGYSEDKLQQSSVFAADDNQSNDYHAGLSKTLPSGTAMNAEIRDTRLWSNSAFVSKNPYHNAEFSLDVKQPLGRNMFGFADRANITLTRLAVKNASLELRDRVEAFIEKVEMTYLDLVLAEKTVEIYQGIMERARRLYDNDLKNFDMGLIERVDIYASEANVANLEAELLLAENACRRSEEVLKMLMNLDAEVRIRSEYGGAYSGGTGTLADCLKEAFAGRRDYLAAKRECEIKDLDVRVKENRKWPEIDLTLSMKTNGLEEGFGKAVDKMTGAGNTYYYAGIEVSVPLENSEARSLYIKKKEEKTRALMRLKEIEREIITEVGNSFGDVKAFEGSLEFMSRAVKLQSDKLSEEEKRFSRGRSGTKRLIDYQQDLLRAELEEVRSLVDRRKAGIALERSMNTLLARYEEFI